MNALKAKITALTAWKRRFFCMVLGLLAAGALPPLYLLFLLPIAFSGLVWLIEGSRSKKQAFGTGWWFGLGYFLAGLYWIVLAFFVQAATFGWMSPFALLGLSAGMALYCGAACLVTFLVPWRGAAMILVFASSWTGFEMVRGWFLSGFPWNLIGSVWAVSDEISQTVAVMGIYGLGFLTVLIVASPAIWTDRKEIVFCMVALLALLWGAGFYRLNQADTQMVEGVRLRLVQGNIAQRDKWKTDLRKGHVLNQLELSLERPELSPTHVIWPETAVPFFISRTEGLLGLLKEAVPSGGALITGAPRATPQGEPFRVWNSIFGIDDQGTVEAVYDKVNLVPFGEFVPFRDFLKIGKLTVGGTDFSAGPERITMNVTGLPPFSPLICYEIIFPGRAVAGDGKAQWLLNLTNDAWFGISSGPYQHFANARLRAIEEGLPLVRAANTGISGIVDPFGRIVVSLGLGKRGTVDGGLPKPLATGTVFGSWGNVIVVGLAAFLLVLTGLLLRVGNGGFLRGKNEG